MSALDVFGLVIVAMSAAVIAYGAWRMSHHDDEAASLLSRWVSYSPAALFSFCPALHAEAREKRLG